MRCWWPVLALMWPMAAGAQDPPAAADEPLPLVVPADAPVPVWVNGLAVQLAVSTGTVDHVTLNDDAARRIGLSAVPQDYKADLNIGGRAVLQGRHGGGWLAHGGRLRRLQLYWFPGEQRLPLAGTIGPFALPHWRVRVEWPLPVAPAAGAAAEALDLPLVGGIDRAAYGVVRDGPVVMAVGVDVRVRRALPLVTAATGADLAAHLGGRLVGEVWSEEILLGVRRPVRRLQLDRPLRLGPIRIDAVAVRQGGPRDGTASLEKGQIAPLDAEEDPEVMQVRGRILKQRAVARYIMLTRTQLEAAGCSSLTVDKLDLRFRLDCRPPGALLAGGVAAVAAASAAVAAVPVAVPADPLVDQIIPPAAETRINVGAPLSLAVDGQPQRLLLGDAGSTGLLLDNRAPPPMSPQELRRLRDELAERSRNLVAALGGEEAPAPDLGLAQNPEFVAQMHRKPESAEVGLKLGEQAVRIMADWREPNRRSGNDGIFGLAALPVPRLRVMWGDGPAADGEHDLALTIGGRSHDQSVMGVATLPGIDALFVGIDPGNRLDRPLVSTALGQDLVRLHGGTYAEPPVRWRDAGGERRVARQLQLATPLVLGPLSITRVLVDQAPGVGWYLRQLEWPGTQPWPDWPRIAGLERELRLPVAMLAAAGCRGLAIDKPARAWRLLCAPAAVSDQSEPPSSPLRATPGGAG